MRSRRRLCVVILGAAMLLHGRPARADWWLVPFGGAAFSGRVSDGPRVTLGGSAAWTRGSWLGFEVDAARTTDFFTISDITSPLFDKSSVTTLTGSALITSPRAWWGDRLRPYGVAGLGSIRTRIGSDDEFVSVKNTHVGLTLGGGVTSMIEDHVGIRVDVRYLRDLQGLDSDSEFFSLGEGHVDSWRGTVGAVIRF